METWTPERLKKARENWEAGNQKPATQTAKAPETKASPKETSGEWTPERIKKARESWETGTPARATAAGGITTAGSLSGQVLAQMMGSAGGTGSTNPKLQLAVPQTKQSTQAYPGKNGIVTGQSAAQTTPLRGGTAQPEWLSKAQPQNQKKEQTTAPAARVTGTVQPTEQQRIAGIARGDEGWYAQQAQNLKKSFEPDSQTDRFDELNQWMDADPRRRKLVSLMRTGTGGQSYAERNNALQPRSVSGAAASAAVPEKSAGGRSYTDAELLEKGYSRKEISEARQYIEDFDALPGWQRAARRTANTIGGVGDTVASSVFLAGESGVQSVKNAAATSGNWKQLQQSVQDDDRQRTLLNLMTGGKTRYAEQDHSMPLTGSSQSGSDSNAYTDAELMAKGYTRQEIYNMRARIAGTEVHDGVDSEKSFGYQLYKRGQNLTAAAQAGLSPIAKQALGIVSSAGENLAVAGINPAAVLPVLSAQGGAEAMGQSIEKGESAGKTLAGGLAKFGAGWAINSVGAADLAKTMGSDYAKDTLAGKLADAVRSVAADGRLAQQYPAIANTISGGVDNAMQAFVETYADKAIDAALGDSEAAESMFTAETFLNAVESGLAGGASGALGGAVGTGLGKMSAALNAAAGGHTAAAEDAAQKVQQAVQDELRAREPTEKQMQTTDSGRTLSPLQSGDAGAATELSRGESFSQRNEPVTEQTAVNDNPAEHTPAQNASIAQYKDSVDPEMKAYVDKVRAGEDLPPYMVTETSDRMRSAMMELTGLDKVGSMTMLDKNGVQHITNRHGGGDGSADGTMKESADVARAAYVLNNFDNAYLSNRKAEGYFNSKGKRASIVIFEKKIDGSHVVVEAVCDTKKDTNYIVTEYLAKNGVDAKEIAKGLRSPMNAVDDPEAHVRNVVVDPSAIPMAEVLQPSMNVGADPRDTSKTLADLPSAETNVTQQAGEVNGNAAENAGKPSQLRNQPEAELLAAPPKGEPSAKESSPADYADVELRADMANLDTDSWTRAEQAETAKSLAQHYRMSDAAVQTAADNMPEGVGAEVYAPAAAMLYRLGVNGEGSSFEDALKLTGGGGALSGAVQQVLAVGDTGRTALNLAYLQGRGEAEHYREVKAAELGRQPGKEALRPDAGTLYNPDGSVRQSKRADDALIELTAGANGVAAQRVVKGLGENAKGLIRSAAGAVFYSSEADTATVLHETLHEVNSWDAKGGQELIDAFEHYLVVQNGMESVQKLVESYLDRYERAGQSLTYNQAMEEITADAMQSIFGDEESFRNFLRQQTAEAKMNAAAQGKTDRVMTRIENLLKKVLTDIKSLLVKEPTNAAAKAAKTLTEAQLKDLQRIYFNHQADAGENYRAALEANGGANKNAADISDAAAGEGKYSIDPDYAEKIDEWYREGRSDDEVFILGRTGDTLQQLGARENDIYMNSDKINKILHDHPEMTLEEIKRIPEVLDDPTMVLTSQNKGRSRQNTRLVMFGNVKAQDGRPVLCILDLRPVENHIVINDMQKVASAYTKDVNPVGFVRNSTVLYLSENKEKTTELFRTLGFKIPSELQSSGLMGSIAYGNQDVKLEGVKFTELEGAPETRYQLDVDSEDVEAAKEAQLGKGREAAETVRKIAEMTEGAKVSDESLECIARKMVKQSSSKADAKTLASRLRALSDYLSSGRADMAEAHGFVLDMAQQIMERSAKKNDELWKRYPELHEMGMSLEKGSKDYNEVLYRYGSWAEARKELAKHGVKLTLTKNGEISRWDADFTELQGIGGGLFPTETPTSAADALEAMAAAHDAIKPTMESAYDSDWDAAKQEMAMEIWGEYLGLPGIASEKNAALRAEFAEKREQMNTAARKEAIRLQAEANLAAAKQRGTERQKMRKYYAQGQAESEIRLAQAQIKNAERLAKVRESRDKDNTRRAIRKAAGQLTKMIEHAGDDFNKYVPEYLLDKVLPVAQLANEAIGNRETAQRLAQLAHRGEAGWTYAPMKDGRAQMEKAMDGLRRGIQREVKESDRASMEWQNSGLADAIDEWLMDVNDNRETEIEKLRGKIEDAKRYTREDESPSWTAYVDGLNLKLATLENGGMATLSADELRGLRDILDQTLHIIRMDNVVVGAQEDAMIDDFAQGAKEEIESAKGIDKKEGKLHKLNRKFNSYRMNTMNIERMLERMGGYVHGGYMENLGKMLNDGQRKKTKILIEGTRIFDKVAGPGHEKELYHFTHDLVDIGLKDDSGRVRKITHSQLAELAVQLQNKQGVHHIVNGGITLENMEAKVSGDAELAKLDKATVHAGQLQVTDAEGKPLNAYELSRNEDAERRSLLEEIDKHLTDYDRAWMEAYKESNRLMSGYINETSLILSGTRKATTENYIHINVDSDTNPEQNMGIRYDNSAANPNFLNHRVNSSKPVLLVGLVQQAVTSIENTAQYAGMAIPLRNAEKILNSMPGGRTLFKSIEENFGTAGREYINKALADLCEVKDSREVGDGAFAKLRSYAAQAALNANVNVTLLQAASLPTAAAELGWGATGSAAVQFGKNLADLRNVLRFFGADIDSSLTKIEQRMAEHGDGLLAYRLRGTGVGEIGNAEAQKGFLGRTHDAARNSSNKAVSGVTRAADKVVSLWTAGITKMDEITVAACWKGTESYVKAHPEEFAAGAEVMNSPEYWAAVNEKFQQVVEHTQPNYTTMQRTGFQRSKNEMTKTLMMFSTQRQQNAQILTAAMEDLAAQKARYKGVNTEEAKQAKAKAAARAWNAVSSQVVQTTVIAALGVGVKFGLHRWKDLQDDNGDMTLWSAAADFFRQWIKSFGSNWTGVSEAMTAADLIRSGGTTTYSAISINGIEVLNDIVDKIHTVWQLEAKDTSGMTEGQLDAYNDKMREAVVDMLGQFAAARGIPYSNLKKQVEAVNGWADTLNNWNKKGGNFDSLPQSATGQYDRLYNAYLNGDSIEARAAVEKLNGMAEAGIITENKMYEQLTNRLMDNDRIKEAAKQTNAGNWEARKDILDDMAGELNELLGTSGSDARDAIVKAIDAVSVAQYAAERGHDKKDGYYTDLKAAAAAGDVKEMQTEVNSLLKAGKTPDNIKDAISKAVRDEYKAGSDSDREEIEESLLQLVGEDGETPLYTEKTFSAWAESAEKEAEEKEFDRRDLLK